MVHGLTPSGTTGSINGRVAVAMKRRSVHNDLRRAGLLSPAVDDPSKYYIQIYVYVYIYIYNLSNMCINIFQSK